MYTLNDVIHFVDGDVGVIVQVPRDNFDFYEVVIRYPDDKLHFHDEYNIFCDLEELIRL